MSVTERPLPYPDRDSRPWWEALARHELVLQSCECGTRRWPARAMCNRCGSFEWSWVPATGRGTVASWIVNHHSFNPSFQSPYVVLDVRLDDQDDIIMPGGYAGPGDGSDLAVGLPVVVDFEDVSVPEGTDPVTVLRWRRAPGDGGESA